ncbi:MAG: HNH endonuclease, partial [Candidatus Latescibacterota bacterium]
QVNHIQERSHGGPDTDWNLHAVCAAHHLHYIHAGRASVRGRAPGNMVWRLGRPELAQWFVNERRIRSTI